jgi:alpha-ribazole phosphatase
VTTVTRWWFVRHAPVPGMKGRLYGSSDVACDTSDTDAFAALANKLPGDAIWLSSHLTRTHETAAAIRDAGLDAPAPIVEPDIREQDFGDWAELTWDEMQQREPDTYARFWEAPARNAPPGGESFADVVIRTARVIESYTAAHAGRDIVAVCHGGSIRGAVAHAMGLTPEAGMAVVVDTLSLTRIDHIEGAMLRGKGSAWRLLGINHPPDNGLPGGVMR